MLKSRRFWLGVVISLVFIGLFLYRVDLGEMSSALRGANYIYVLPAIAAYFVAVYFRTLRWQFLLGPLGRVSLSRLFPIVVVGYMANNLLPVRLGELVRAYYLGYKTDLSKTSGLATVFVERIFDGLTLLFFAAAVSLFLPTLGLLKGLGQEAGIPWIALTLGLSLPFLVAVAIMTAAASNPPWLQGLVERLLRLAPERFRPQAARLVALFIQGLAVLRSPRRLVVVFLFSIPVWLSEAVMYFILGFSFDFHHLFASWGQMVAAILLVTAIANLGISVPSSQGGVGPFEFFAKVTLALLGIAAEVAAAYAVVLHVALLAPVTLLGLFYLWMENLSLGQLTAPGRGAPEPRLDTLPLKGDDTG